MPSSQTVWRKPMPWLLGFLGLAVLGVGIATILFASWTEYRDATSGEAAGDFAKALAAASAAGPQAGIPYVSVDSIGTVHVDRSLESDPPTELRTLHLLAWDPQEDRLVQVAFPFWFVRVKMNDAINLGTMTTALSGDWDHLDLKVSVGELRRRGAGVVLDHTRQDGMRLLLWSEAK